MLDSKDLLDDFMRGILAYPYIDALVKGEGGERKKERGRRRSKKRRGGGGEEEGREMGKGEKK